MKLVSGFYLKKGVVAAAMILVVSVANARVFWNKVEATTGNDGIVMLTWNVTEYNNKQFEVQHSTDGIKWEILAIVVSHNSPESMTDYSYTHKNRHSGKQYYRIKDIDVDVSYSSFSPIKTLIIKNDRPHMNVWPNPATDRITVERNDNGETYTKATIFNLGGKAMIERKLTEELTDIPVAQLPSGTYIIKIETGTGKSQSRKFIKY